MASCETCDVDCERGELCQECHQCRACCDCELGDFYDDEWTSAELGEED